MTLCKGQTTDGHCAVRLERSAKPRDANMKETRLPPKSDIFFPTLRCVRRAICIFGDRVNQVAKISSPAEQSSLVNSTARSRTLHATIRAAPPSLAKQSPFDAASSHRTNAICSSFFTNAEFDLLQSGLPLLHFLLSLRNRRMHLIIRWTRRTFPESI